ncbi:MAG: hypothetical protein RR651_10345 [Lysinibacillus sp.]
MKNNSSIYFDIWRKRNFKNLIHAYIETAAKYPTKIEMRLGFGYALDKYVEGGRGSYEGTLKQWYSAYTLGRELGVFYSENENGGYDLSPMANDVLLGKIDLEDYLVNYFINFNQLINGKVVHPLKEIIICIADNNGEITIEDVKRIKSFNLEVKQDKNKNQLANILLNRLVEANILSKNVKEYRLQKYQFSELFQYINVYEGTSSEFEKMSHEEYVVMLSKESLLISHKD